MNTIRSLEAVLEELVLSGERPSKEALARWVARFPEYKEGICEFVSEWQRQDALPDANVQFDAQAASAAALVRSVIRAELERQDDAEGFRGIFAQAQALGLRVEDEAAKLGVNVQLLDLLDRKRVMRDTIPKSLVAALSAPLKVSARRLGEWLAEGLPSSAAPAQFGPRGYKVPESLMPFEKAWKQAGLSASARKRWAMVGQRTQS